jgi:Cu2+-containing amine oxidase
VFRLQPVKAPAFATVVIHWLHDHGTVSFALDIIITAFSDLTSSIPSSIHIITSEMSLEQITNGINGLIPNGLPLMGKKKAKQLAQHPISPLSASEITQASGLVREQWPAGTKFHFKAVTLLEPPKDVLFPYLEAERRGEQTGPITRKAFVVYYIRSTVSPFPLYARYRY